MKDPTLDILTRLLASYSPPEGTFDPSGQWSHEYGCYSLSAIRQSANGPNATPVGRLRLTRRTTGDGIALDIEHDKFIDAARRHRVRGRLECADDRWMTLRRGQLAAAFAGSESKLEPKLSQSLIAGEGYVEVTGGGSHRRLPAPPPLVCSFALFDIVQRLPAQLQSPLSFNLLDHFDEVKPRQMLRSRKPVTVSVGGKWAIREQPRELEKGVIYQRMRVREGTQPLRLHGFEQLGEGIVPWVYWLDDQRRLLFVVAGLEAYALQSSG